MTSWNDAPNDLDDLNDIMKVALQTLNCMVQVIFFVSLCVQNIVLSANKLLINKIFPTVHWLAVTSNR